jgi:DNA-binding transcriptional MerR regulator
MSSADTIVFESSDIWGDFQMPEPMEHLLSIKEASRLTGVPAYTLRFWEKEFDEFLKPPRTEGGQRRFDQESLKMVERIKRLVDDEKYSIAGARGVLASEKQQREQRDDVSLRLRNEAQIDLILDEIAEIVREKVLARLLRDEGSNRIVGERVPGLKASHLAAIGEIQSQAQNNAARVERPISPVVPDVAPVEQASESRPAEMSPAESPTFFRRPTVGTQSPAQGAFAVPGSASNSPLRHTFGTILTPKVTES